MKFHQYNASDNFGKRPLHYRKRVLIFLLDNGGAEVNAISGDESEVFYTALDIAKELKLAKIKKILFDHRAILSKYTKEVIL